MSLHRGPSVQLSVVEELKLELDLVPTLLLLLAVPTVQGNLPREGCNLVTTSNVQVSTVVPL